MEQVTPRRRKIPQIEFTRFVGAMSIVVYHFGTTVVPFHCPPLNNIASSGNLAVSYFFVLSGYVAALSYDKRMPGLARAWKEYSMQRVAKIYPIHLLTLILVLSFQLISHPELVDYKTVALNLVLLQAWVPSSALSLNYPAWALSVLVFFWIAFPFVVTLLERLSNAGLLIAIITAWGLSLIVHILLLKTMYKGFPSNNHNFIYYNPLMHFNAFLIGMGAGMLLTRMKGEITQVNPLLISGGATLLIVMVMSGYIPQILQYAHNGLLAPIFALFLFGLSADESVVSRLLSKKLFVTLGGISFCIYMLQSPVHILVYHVLTHFRFLAGSESLHFMIYVTCLISTAYITYFIIDIPVSFLSRNRHVIYER